MAHFPQLPDDHHHEITPYPAHHVYNPDESGLLLAWKDRVQDKVLKKTDLPLYGHAWGGQPNQNILNAIYFQAYSGRDIIALVDKPSILPAIAFVDALIPPGNNPSNRLRVPPGGANPVLRRELIEQIFVDSDGLRSPFTTVWQPAPLAPAVDNRAQEVRDIDQFIDGNGFQDGFDADAFLTALNLLLENRHRDNYGSYLLSQVIQGLFVFIQRGNATTAKIAKLESALAFNEGIQMDLSPESSTENFMYINQYMLACTPDVNNIFRTAATVFTNEISLRMKLMISQARGAGSAPITITLDAIKKFPTHPVWGLIEDKVPSELVAFIDAARFLAQNPFISYDEAQLQQYTRGTNFPSLVVAAMEISKAMGIGKTLKQYRGKFTSIYHAQIVFLCTAYKAKMDEEVSMASYDSGGPNHLNWNTRFPDLAAVINTVDDIS